MRFFRKGDYINKTIKKPLIKRIKIDTSWIMIITISAFLIGLGLSLFAEITIPTFGLTVGIILLLIFILLGILFDIIGVAVMVADTEQFHSMAAKKIRGAKLAIKLVSKKEHVASFCNDVVGDISGIMSGSAGLVVASYISTIFSYDRLWTVVLVTSVTGALIIGGKALGKSMASNMSNYIVYEFAKILSYFYNVK